ncbi:MAG: N-acetylmuramoyl-L-alanine amidase [Ktedonobacteraceae bacterium]|nr:N-acetylmuramoyl-L-alanine amidase [Ktedonobacteraceae bacterium]
MPDENGAIWIPNSNSFPRRNGYKPRYVILHGTAGGASAVAIANFFKSTEGSNNAVSSHYVVGRDGEIVQCVSERDGAWTNGYISGPAGTAGDGYGNGYHDAWWGHGVNPNLITVTIEHVKPSADNSDHLTDAQKQASFRLIKHICERHGIPQRKADAQGGITGHYSIDPVNRKFCPGAYPWNELFAYLANGGEDVLTINQASQYFTEVVKDQRWHCKQTGFDIAYAILEYYRTCTRVALNGLSQYGLPLSKELSIPGTHGAVIQRFERGCIIYDPRSEVDRVPGLSGPCYPAHIDKGPGADPRIAQLEAQLAAAHSSQSPQQQQSQQSAADAADAAAD